MVGEGKVGEVSVCGLQDWVPERERENQYDVVGAVVFGAPDGCAVG